MDSITIVMLIAVNCVILVAPLILIYVLRSCGVIGLFPAAVKTELEREEILFIKEGVSMTVRLRSFRAPGRYAFFNVKWGIGAFAVTKKRVVGYRGRSNCVLDVPLDHSKIGALQFSAKGEKTLCAIFEASEFDEKQSGGVELRFGLGDVSQVMTILRRVTKSVR